MANTISQPSANPTNKLTAATVTGVLVSVIGLALKNLAPEWYDPQLLLTASPIIALVVGWFFSDKPNIVVITTQDQQPEQQPAFARGSG